MDAIAAGTAVRPWTDADVWPQGWSLAAYLLLGLIAGVASALFGIGSGVIIVPVLSAFLGVPISRAVGISIVSVCGIVSAGVIIETIATSNIQWWLAVAVALGAQIGVRLGGRVAPKIPERALRWALVVLVVLTAAKLAKLLPGAPTLGLVDASHLLTPWIVVVALIGVFSGFLSVLLGIGGGIIVVPALLLLLSGIGFREARATSLAIIVPTSLAGTFVHARRGNVFWRSVVPIVVPGFFGALCGVALANSIPNAWLRETIFPIFLVIMAVRLAIGRRR